MKCTFTFLFLLLFQRNFYSWQDDGRDSRDYGGRLPFSLPFSSHSSSAIPSPPAARPPTPPKFFLPPLKRRGTPAESTRGGPDLIPSKISQ